jgi:hypothetical protein
VCTLLILRTLVLEIHIHIATFILDAFDNINMYSKSKVTDIQHNLNGVYCFITKMNVHHHTQNFFTKINNSMFVFAAYMVL